MAVPRESWVIFADFVVSLIRDKMLARGRTDSGL